MTEEEEQDYDQPQKVQTLYEIIGCEPTATFDEIKRAYRKKAFELHPDRNQDDPHATEKFQQLSQAYEILKDPVKREQYDRFGLTGDNPGEMDDMAQFEMMTQIIGIGRNRPPPTGPKVSPTFRMIKVPMKNSYLGTPITQKIELCVVCPLCNGTGSNDGQEYPMCTECSGTGSLFPGGGFTFFFPCKSCNKVGFIIPPEKICKKCKGHKVILVKKNIEIPIEIGIDTMEQITLRDKGDEYPGKEPADLNLLVMLKNQNGFVRDGDDLFYQHDISNIECSNGTAFTVTTLDDRKLFYHTKEKEPIQYNRLCMIPNEGFPCKGNVQLKGNLYIRFSPPLFGIPGAVIFPFLEFGRAAASAIRKSKNKGNSVLLEYMPIEQQQVLFDKEREENEYEDTATNNVPNPNPSLEYE